MNECLDVVNKLNIELYEKHNETEWVFWYRTSGYADQIGLNDTIIWCSETDGTEYDPETNEPIALIDHVRNNLKRYIDKFNRLFVDEEDDEQRNY